MGTWRSFRAGQLERGAGRRGRLTARVIAGWLVALVGCQLLAAVLFSTAGGGWWFPLAYFALLPVAFAVIGTVLGDGWRAFYAMLRGRPGS